MTAKEVIEISRNQLDCLKGSVLDVVDVKKPTSIDYAINLSKVVSKLSPLIGNMIEFSIVDILNSNPLFHNDGKWVRQDPGFPDALYTSNTIPFKTGIEIKAWFPFATEITARFKDSVLIFVNDSIYVALIAWLPENVIYGKPIILDVALFSGKSIAEARDSHYHRPPGYIVLEPEDTSARTGNLQQTNTNGYKFQEDFSDINDAIEYIKQFGADFMEYKPFEDYQQKVRQLHSQFRYRLDTNYAKIDRIEHKGIEDFKYHVDNEIIFHGKSIKEWRNLLFRGTNDELERELRTLL